MNYENFYNSLDWNKTTEMQMEEVFFKIQPLKMNKNVKLLPEDGISILLIE